MEPRSSYTSSCNGKGSFVMIDVKVWSSQGKLRGKKTGCLSIASGEMLTVLDRRPPSYSYVYKGRLVTFVSTISGSLSNSGIITQVVRVIFTMVQLHWPWAVAILATAAESSRLGIRQYNNAVSFTSFHIHNHPPNHFTPQCSLRSTFSCSRQH